MFLKKKKLSRNFPRWRCRREKPACRLFKTSQESRAWLISLRQSIRVLFSLLLSPSQKSVRLIPAENERTQLCLLTELAEEKPQSLHSQKLPRWAQQIC